MGSNKKRHQTFSKRNRERAVEEKRRLKRERKQAAAAERAAIRDGTYIPPVLTAWSPRRFATASSRRHGADGVEPTATRNGGEPEAGSDGVEPEPVAIRDGAEPSAVPAPPDGD